MIDGGMLSDSNGSQGLNAAGPEWKLVPQSDARIAVIDSADDYDHLTALYPARHDPTQLSLTELSQDYDALHITPQGMKTPELRGFGGPGTRWMRWVFTETAAHPSGIAHGHHMQVPPLAGWRGQATHGNGTPLHGAARDYAIGIAQELGKRKGRAAGVYGVQGGFGPPPRVPHGTIRQDDSQQRQVNQPAGIWTVNASQGVQTRLRWRATPLPTARIAVVDDERDYERLRRLYPNPHNPAFLSFEALSKDFDAFHVTPNGLSVLEAATHMHSRPGTVWFRWVFSEPMPRAGSGGVGNGPVISSPRSMPAGGLIEGWMEARRHVHEELRTWRATLHRSHFAESDESFDAAIGRDALQEVDEPVYEQAEVFETAVRERMEEAFNDLQTWQEQNSEINPESVRQEIEKRLNNVYEDVINGMLGYTIIEDAITDPPTMVAVCRKCKRPRGHRPRQWREEVEDGHGRSEPESSPAEPCPYCGG